MQAVIVLQSCTFLRCVFLQFPFCSLEHSWVSFFRFSFQENQWANPANCNATKAREQVVGRGRTKWWKGGKWGRKGLREDGSFQWQPKQAGVSQFQTLSSYYFPMVPRLDCPQEAPSVHRKDRQDEVTEQRDTAVQGAWSTGTFDAISVHVFYNSWPDFLSSFLSLSVHNG